MFGQNIALVVAAQKPSFEKHRNGSYHIYRTDIETRTRRSFQPIGKIVCQPKMGLIFEGKNERAHFMVENCRSRHAVERTLAPAAIAANVIPFEIFDGARAHPAASGDRIEIEPHHACRTNITPGAVHRPGAHLAAARPDEIKQLPDHFFSKSAGYSPAATSLPISEVTYGLSSR